jgi:hypothetical protein
VRQVGHLPRIIPICTVNKTTFHRHITYIYCLSEMFNLSSFYSDTLSSLIVWHTRKRWNFLIYGFCATLYISICYCTVLGRDSSVGTGDSPRDGRSGDRISVGARFSAPVQTGPRPHQASYTMGTGSQPHSAKTEGKV